MDGKFIPGWLKKFLDKAAIQKEALDKLPQDELNGVMPNMMGNADPSMGMDPSMMGGMPAAPAPMPEAEAAPMVWDNKYLVQTDSAKFIVELTPSIVTQPGAAPAMPAGQTDPMADTSLNPSADPNALSQWMQGQEKEKPFTHSEEGTVDPLSREEEGLPVEDVGNEQMLPSVKVHNKRKADLEHKADDEMGGMLAKTPGADRSNAYPPCKYCPNYIASDNQCKQGLDTEKVQAAGSCSWLNSNFKPFKDSHDPMQDPYRQDKETFKNDVSDLQGGGQSSPSGGGTTRSIAANQNDEKLNEYLKQMWD